MSYGGWGSNSPAPGRSLPLSGSVGHGGWTTGLTGGGGGFQQQQQDEAKFNSLFPIGGLVTGEQVKPVFEASGLPAAKLAQIWSSVDKNHDGKINRSEFCSAMTLIRQAQQSNLMNSSLPASALSGFTGSSLLSSTTPSNSWSLGNSATPSSSLGMPSPTLGVAGQGWALTPQDKRRYTLEFNAIDVSKSGFLSGQEARTLLTKTGLDKMLLAKIWELSDINKDGKLSCEEYAIAMHLVAKVRGGASLPSNLPAELYGPAKYYTVDRVAAKAAKAGKPQLEKKASIPDQIGHTNNSPSLGHTRNPSGGQSPKVGGHARNPSGGQSPKTGGHTRNPSGGSDAITFEDKRKENFEAGRMELERRRRAIREQQEREAAEKERKKREEEERRLQQEREAEQARQAELERQRRKAMEIELERERQMKKLALQREQEERELERKRKAEWTRKKCKELEGQRDWEKKSLHSLRVQHSQLEDQLRQLDQKKLSVLASTERHKNMFSTIILELRSIRVSHDVRRAELSRMQSELNDYHTQLSSLQRQRRELREALQARSPEMSLYQQQRQELKDKIIGLAASLAGLRSNLSHNSKTAAELTDTFKSNSQLFEDLNLTFRTDQNYVSELRQKVLTQQQAFEEAQRIEREEAELREAEERREREERERVRREVEERARREERLQKIKKDQEMALKKAKMEDLQAKLTPKKPTPYPSKPPLATKPPEAIKTTPPVSVAEPKATKTTPPVSVAEPKVTKTTPPVTEAAAAVGWSVEDEEVEKKVQELKKKRENMLRKQKSKDTNPSKPTPYTDKKQPSSEKKGKLVKQETVDKNKGKNKKGKAEKDSGTLAAPQLLNLDSSWDSTAEISPGISSFVKDTNQILQPQALPTVTEASEDRERGEPVAQPVPKPWSRSVSRSPEHQAAGSTSGKSRYSVAALSKMFNEGPVGWSTDIQKQTSPDRQQQQQKQQLDDYANLEDVVTSPEATSPPAPLLPPSSPASTTSPAPPSSHTPTPAASQPDPAPGTRYRAMYDYEAVRDDELSLAEGEVVSLVSVQEGGWLVVSSGSREGWAPVSYLEELADKDVGVVSDVGVAKETGQVMSTEQEPVSPVLSPQSVHATVKFAWKGSKDNHLTLVRGETIRVLQQSEKWWSGEYQGKVGWFPKTFVKILDAPPPAASTSEATPISSRVTPTPAVTTPTPPPKATPAPAQVTTPTPAMTTPTPTRATPIALQVPSGSGRSGVMMCEAIYEYVGDAEGDLSFQPGDVIEVTSSDGEWWSGVLNGVTGTFPSNYVQLKDEGSTSVPASPLSLPSSPSIPPAIPTSSKPQIARVLVDYQTTKRGQLELTAGQLVKVLKQADNGWWEGELQSRGKRKCVGWFPANRVELLPHRLPKNPSSSSISSSITSPTHSITSESRAARARSPLLEVLEDSKSISSLDLVLALYTYTAQSADELSFHKGSVITVLGKEGEWWRGEVNEKTGLFPSNYVQPLSEQQPSATEPTRWADSVSPEVLASVTDMERKRQEAIFELLTTERHYVDSLKLVQEVFFDPMAQGEVLTEEEMAKVIVNWDELIRCSSELLSSFLVRLRTSGEVVRGIGDVLAAQIPNLTPHIRWCGCQLNACLLLQQKASDPKFKEFEQTCSKDPRTGGLPLSSFLLKPMQRVTKYPLLVKKILDYTPASDSDYTDLKGALTEAKTLCDHVNDGVRQKENTEHLEWLQSHVVFTNLEEKLVFNSQTNFMGPRKLLHWGKLFKIRGSKDLVGFLFNDFLLLVRPKLFFPRAATPADLEPWGKNEFQMYRKPYLLDGLKGKRAGDTDASGGSQFYLLQGSPDDKDILLRVESDKIRDEWIKKLTKASLDYLTTKKKMEREKQEQYMRTMRDSVGKLEVTVVEGTDLLAKDPNGKSDPFCVIRLGEQQEQTTPVVQNNLNPKWNYTMHFAVHDINKDVIDITVFDKDLFSPNDFLGCGHVSLKDLLQVKDSPWEKTVLLENVASGEITLKISLSLNKSNLLL